MLCQLSLPQDRKNTVLKKSKEPSAGVLLKSFDIYKRQKEEGGNEVQGVEQGRGEKEIERE